VRLSYEPGGSPSPIRQIATLKREKRRENERKKFIRLAREAEITKTAKERPRGKFRGRQPMATAMFKRKGGNMQIGKNLGGKELWCDTLT